MKGGCYFFSSIYRHKVSDNLSQVEHKIIKFSRRNLINMWSVCFVYSTTWGNYGPQGWGKSSDEIHSFGIEWSFYKVNRTLHYPIFNVIESGMPLDPSKLKVIRQMGIKRLYHIIGGSGRENITVQGSTSVDVLPPYVVYSGKNLYLNWTRDGYPGSMYRTSGNGWMDTNVYRDWFKRMFIPCIGRERPVLLIFDGHASHVGIQVIKLAIENYIHLLRLPSHTTHFLQPLDVGVYRPVKKAWTKILVEFIYSHIGKAPTKEFLHC